MSNLLTPATPGLREALEAGRTQFPDSGALWKIIFAGRDDLEALSCGVRIVSRHVLTGMLEWLDTPGLQAHMPLEQYATLLSNGVWPPPVFLDPTFFMYCQLMTPEDESMMDLQSLVDNAPNKGTGR